MFNIEREINMLKNERSVFCKTIRFSASIVKYESGEKKVITLRLLYMYARFQKQSYIIKNTETKK